MWEPEVIENLKILLYGDSGVGKTRFCATMPKPLFLDADHGLRSIKIPCPFITINNWADLQQAYMLLSREEHSFETVVIDSLSRVQKMCMDNVVESYPSRRVYDNLPSQQDWNKALDDLFHMISFFVSLPMNVVFTAHTKPRRFEDERAEPLLSGKNTISALTQSMDIVAYMFVQEVEEGEKPVRKMGFDLAGWWTKDRTDQLPPVLENPIWGDLTKFWNTGK